MTLYKQNTSLKEASLKIAVKRDTESVRRSEARSTEENRYARRTLKRQKKAKEQAKIRKEGPSYGPEIAK